ncbi:hypothetical protein CCR75_008385 [Bremia lactucae]|uniref:INTS8 TPR repeats domain-containing protein n=1 Tax=Bremia lactucae TaxID=4779 RepID=A0A976NZ93_BRELC|nr:hypothetical protein CCR75_008385 [Bremia lactucae]
MPLMPGSPRPCLPASQDDADGVYRSLFQQPIMDIPPAAPSYAWFEFLLHPDALRNHLNILYQQRKSGVHSATSAIELVREFLDQAQLVANEGNVRNKRYTALLLVAAQVALQMQLSLDDIEKGLPLHFQRLLLDGIVDFADQPCNDRNECTNDITMQPHEAHMLHNRWTLRALVSQSLNGFLTCNTRSESEEILFTYQMALGDLMKGHLQIAQNIETTLINEESLTLSVESHIATYNDLGRYFFSFNGFKKAYNCFARAIELLEDVENDNRDMKIGTSSKWPAEIRTNLEGYIAACEAVIERHSLNDGLAALNTPMVQIKMAWDDRDWDTVIELLEIDIVASELTRLPRGFRAALEQQAFHLLRSSVNDLVEDDLQITGVNIRFFYKRLVLENAVMNLLVEVSQEEETALSACVCTCIRLLQDEMIYSKEESRNSNGPFKNCFAALARFVLRLSEFAMSKSYDDSVKTQVIQFVYQVLCHFPCIKELVDVLELLRRCGVDYVTHTKVVPFEESLDRLIIVEDRLRVTATKQREQFHSMAHMGGMIGICSAVVIRDSDVVGLQNELRDMAISGRKSDFVSRNLITFCAENKYWDILSQCTTAAPVSSYWLSEIHFVASCGALCQYLSTLSASFISANSKAGSVASLATNAGEIAEFSIAKSNKFMADILLKWRVLLNEVRADSKEEPSNETQTDEKMLMGLPVWIVETLICISAGLLHRAYMRNACDYRVSFDLYPYGEIAFLEAFVPDKPPSGAATIENSDAQFATVPFLKNYLEDLVALHSQALENLVSRCSREPRWHCAKADLHLNPLSKQRLASVSDPRAALESYLVAALLATNFFSDMYSVKDIIDQGSLVRLSQCLVKVGAHVAAAVLYQCFMPEEFKYGLRILRLAPESHDEAFFQYFWELSFLELLVDLHTSPRYYNDRHVTLLTSLIQSPEVNSSNPTPVVNDAEQRILRCYFRDLCKIFLCD